MKKIIIIFTMLTLGNFFCASAKATPIQWSSNGHYYEYSTNPALLTWEAAKLEAENSTYLGLQGHLATITSAAEDLFIRENITPASKWLGGYQQPGSIEPTGGWTWITGELWDYTNWGLSQPDNQGGIENALSYWYYGLTWNDVSSSTLMRGLIEYESANPVPEPSSIILGLVGICGALGYRKKELLHKLKSIK